MTEPTSFKELWQEEIKRFPQVPVDNHQQEEIFKEFAKRIYDLIHDDLDYEYEYEKEYDRGYENGHEDGEQHSYNRLQSLKKRLLEIVDNT